jgi:V/A-type H+/Na+-transporting ATPase subunit A
MKNEKKTTHATGTVIRALGNLLHVRFEGEICQGEVCTVHLGDLSLAGEVIEVAGDDAKVQVFEDTRGIKLNTPVRFTGHLLQAELGPGLLTSIYDGLQNPLEKVADVSGLFLARGIYLPSLDRDKKWNFTPSAKVGDWVERGDYLGSVPEERFQHQSWCLSLLGANTRSPGWQNLVPTL